MFLILRNLIKYMMTDIEIAREAKITPIQMIEDKLKIDERY